MSDPVFECCVIDLTGLREALELLSPDERFDLVDVWSRLHEQLGRGRSGWLPHFVDQRIDELRGVRFVELGPVTELSAGEFAAVARFARSMVDVPLAPSPFVSRYWGEVGVLFSDRVACLSSARSIQLMAEARRFVHAPATATAPDNRAAIEPPEDQSKPSHER